MSRLRILFALAAALAVGAVLAACGASEGGSRSPQEVLEGATLQGIESGRIDLSLDLKATGAEGGDVEVALSGPFQGEGAGELPQLDMTATANGDYNGSKVDFDGGLVLLPNSAYVDYEGVTYEVDPTTFSFVEQTLKQAQREGGAEAESEGAVACQEEFGKLDVADFFEDGANEGSADVGGTETTKVSGELDVGGSIDALLGVVESGACSAQLAAAGPLPSEEEIEAAKDEVGSSVKAARVSVYVGEDGIVRRLTAKAKIEPQRGGKGPKTVEFDLDLKLTELNEEQEITAPSGGVQPLSKLFVKLDVNPIELLGLLQGEESGESLGDLLEGLGEKAAGQ